MPMPHAMLTPMIGATRNAPLTRSAAGNTVPLASAISYPATNGSSKALSTWAAMLSARVVARVPNLDIGQRHGGISRWKNPETSQISPKMPPDTTGGTRVEPDHPGKKKPRKSLTLRGFWECMRLMPEQLLVPRAGIEPARLAAGDFESPASTNFTTWAGLAAHAPEYGSRRRRRLWRKIRRRASRSPSSPAQPSNRA